MVELLASWPDNYMLFKRPFTVSEWVEWNKPELFESEREVWSHSIESSRWVSCSVRVGYIRRVYAKSYNCKKNTYSVTDYIGSRVCASYRPPLDKSFVIIQKCVELQDGLLFVSTIILYVIQVWSIILHSLGFLDSENFVICICCLFLWRHIGKWNIWKSVKALSMCSCACGMEKCVLILWQHCFHLCAHALGLASFCFFRDTITQDVTDTTTKSCRVPWSTR